MLAAQQIIGEIQAAQHIQTASADGRDGVMIHLDRKSAAILPDAHTNRQTAFS
jgi:hypothetical protein